MIKKYTYIDDNLKAKLFDLVTICNSSDNCNQPYMLDNDTDFFENIPKFFIVKNQSEIRAFASIFFIDEKTVYIYGFTHPHFRNLGLMKKLFKAVIDTLNHINTDNIIIPVSYNNNTGLSFIKHLNATAIETECLMTYSFDDFCDAFNMDDLYLEETHDDDFCKFTLMECTEELSCNNHPTSKEIGHIFCMYDNESACIFDVEIFSEYRGKGYGSKLICLVINQLNTYGIKSINLHVTKENVAAYNLYLKHGFKEKETVTYYLIDRQYI